LPFLFSGITQVITGSHRMDKNVETKFARAIESFSRYWTYTVALFAFLLLIPLNIWFVITYRPTLLEMGLELVSTASFGWGILSAAQLLRGLRKLSASVRVQVFSGSRPTDADELFAWKWGWQFMYAVITLFLSILAIPAVSWITGK
jgi:hypothetical protein